MLELTLPGLGISSFLLECGIFGLVVDLCRRVVRMETKQGLCKACPIMEVKTNV